MVDSDVETVVMPSKQAILAYLGLSRPGRHHRHGRDGCGKSGVEHQRALPLGHDGDYGRNGWLWPGIDGCHDRDGICVTIIYLHLHLARLSWL